MSRARKLEKVDPRSPRVRQIAKLIELSIACGCIGFFYFLAAEAIGALQTARCPETAFACGSPRVASIFMMVSPFFAAIAPGFIAANAVTGALPISRRFFDGDADFRGSRSFLAIQGTLLRMAVVMALAGLGVSFIASLAQFCLTPTAVQIRGAPWEPMRSYPWAAVKSVTTSCVRASKGGWDPGYQLEFADGRTLDIRGGSGNAWKAQRQISEALHPVAFRFDSSRVDPNCGAADLDMLLQRP